MSSNPYTVPPFKPEKMPERIDRFFWWSWHPRYPYWSKSCWGAPTEVEAHEVRMGPHACGLDVYHNKLIRENDDGTLTEVFDEPCKELHVWRKIAKLPRQKGDAIPNE